MLLWILHHVLLCRYHTGRLIIVDRKTFPPLTSKMLITKDSVAIIWGIQPRAVQFGVCVQVDVCGVTDPFLVKKVSGYKTSVCVCVCIALQLVAEGLLQSRFLAELQKGDPPDPRNR